MLVDVFSLLAVSFDRFMVIVFPFRPRLGPVAAYIICGIIWILSFAIASPLITARIYKVFDVSRPTSILQAKSNLVILTRSANG